MLQQVGALRKVLSQQAIGALVRPERVAQRHRVLVGCAAASMVTTMKSVSFPVSWLNPLSEIINEEAGVRSSEILSTVSWGISMRLRTALALSGDGPDRAVCFTGASRSFVAPSNTRKFVRNRHDGPANSRSLVLEFHCGKYVRSQRLLRIFDLDRDIKQRREALTHEELAQLTTDEDGDWDDLFRCASSGSRARNLETSGFRSLGFDTSDPCVAAAVPTLLVATVAA